MKNQRNLLIPAITLILVFAFFSTCFAQKIPKPDAGKKEAIWEIIPGRSIGAIVFGETHIGAVVKLLGNLDNRSPDKTTVYYHNSWGLNFTYNKQSSKVTSVMVLAPGAKEYKYMTNSKVSVDSSIKYALAGYGTPSSNTKVKGYNIYTYFIKDEFLTFFSHKGVIKMIWTGKKEAYDQKIEQVKSQLR